MIGKHRGKKDSGRYLADLYAQQNSLCHWCKSQTALRRFIPDEAVIKENGDEVTWRDGELAFTARIASLDHVEPKRNGPHAHDPANFVLACAECNRQRTKTPSPTPDRLRRVCPGCGEDKDTHRRQCLACFVRGSEGWLAENGWTRVPSHDEGHFMYIDPEDGTPHTLSRAVKVLRQRKGAQPGNSESAAASSSTR